MQKIFTLILALMLVLSLAACTKSGADASTHGEQSTGGNGSTMHPGESDGAPNALVGMWRSRNSTMNCKVYIFDEDGNFHYISTYQSGMQNTRIIVGTYSLNDNILELEGTSMFDMDAGTVPDSKIDQYATDLSEMISIMDTGSINEVKKLFDPNHMLFRTYEVSYLNVDNYYPDDPYIVQFTDSTHLTLYVRNENGPSATYEKAK